MTTWASTITCLVRLPAKTANASGALICAPIPDLQSLTRYCQRRDSALLSFFNDRRHSAVRAK